MTPEQAHERLIDRKPVAAISVPHDHRDYETGIVVNVNRSTWTAEIAWQSQVRTWHPLDDIQDA
jgi:hypothetical protein